MVCRSEKIHEIDSSQSASEIGELPVRPAMIVYLRSVCVVRERVGDRPQLPVLTSDAPCP